jgi:hypothetical protein
LGATRGTGGVAFALDFPFGRSNAGKDSLSSSFCTFRTMKSPAFDRFLISNFRNSTMVITQHRITSNRKITNNKPTAQDHNHCPSCRVLNFSA